MKVICVTKSIPSTCNCQVCMNAFSTVQIGSIYSIVDVNEKGDYAIAELWPETIWWEKEYFAPLSDIDEMELIKQREKISA